MLDMSSKLYASSYISALFEIMKITFFEIMSSTKVDRLWFLGLVISCPKTHAFNWSSETGIQWLHRFEEMEFSAITLERDMGKNEKLTQICKVSTCSSRDPMVYMVTPQLTEVWACNGNAGIQREKRTGLPWKQKKVHSLQPQFMKLWFKQPCF